MWLTPEILSLLEFDKVRAILSSFSFSILGKESILALIPIENREERKQAISLIKEFISLLNSTLTFPTPQDKDIRSILIKVKEGIYSLPSEELIDIGEVTKDYKAVGLYFSKLPGEYKGLKNLCCFSRKLPDVYERVQKVFDESGEIKDSASKELKSIRTGFRKSHKKLLNAASKLVSLKKEFLQEEIFSTKEERIVLPVLVSKKKNVPGIVHSISQTQNTIFVEPIELVELNNDCTTQKLEEEREIKKILGGITKEIRDSLECYERSIEEIRQIDKLYGIASFSEEYSLSVPVFSDKPYISIRGGRHPLLLIKKGKDGVVPFDIELGKDSKMLLISGPNMGGKTVLLKSIGIIVLMAYSGVPIPTMEDSIIPDIDAIYADIGDEQSIELDLSTFSSHIRNIATALRDASDKSLVLLDEVGVGTDPEEGMGIAMVALERFVKKGSLTFATTHYGKLKHFVAGEESMVNASMDFDVDRGVPTYHLSSGIPGSSHGFAIAEKMGFPAELIEKAKLYIDKNQIKADELICSLEELTRKVEIEKKIVDEKKRQLEPLLTMYEEKYGEIKRREKEFLKEAKQRAEEMVYSTRKEMENLVKTIRESQASKESIKKAKDVIEKKIEQFKESKKSVQIENISIGDNVYSEKLSVTGKVIEVLDGYARVETANFRFLAPFESLRSQEAEKKEDNQEIVFSETKELDSKIDIRGMLAEEGEKRVLEFIDEAILSGLSDIQIIHGKGGGVLREKVSLVLKGDKRVEKHRLGYWNEGGSGVTYVKLKS